MRIATKYSMDDVQDAIVRVINSLPFESEIASLAFIAEFPGHFHKEFFKEVFVDACSTEVPPPSGHDLQPLMAFPHIVSLMMKYREGIIQPKRAPWSLRGISASSPEDDWLDDQLERLELAPFLAVSDQKHHDPDL